MSFMGEQGLVFIGQDPNSVSGIALILCFNTYDGQLLMIMVTHSEGTILTLK